MLFLYFVISILFLILIVVIVLQSLKNAKVKELSKKIRLAVRNDDVNKIEFNSNNQLEGIVKNFNKLVRLYKDLKREVENLNVDFTKSKDLEAKVKQVEQVVYQMSSVTDVGKKVTSSLDIDTILKHLYQYVSASMLINEINLVCKKEESEKFIFKSIKTSDKVNSIEGKEAFSEKSSILKWCIENEKEVFLNNVQRDYAQYLLENPKSLEGEVYGSIICYPLMLDKKRIGAIAIYSKQENAFEEDYHISLIKSLASYLSVAIENTNIYSLLNDNYEIIEKEKEKSESLLLNILPVEVANELKNQGFAKAQQFDDVSVLFTDFVGFTRISQNLKPKELVGEINKYFSQFDKIMEKYGVEKIKTIGDAYMAVSGLPTADPDHAENILKAAIEIRDFVKNQKDQGGLFDVRIGINSGSVVAGIIGIKKYAYDIWGDAVNVAARMESNSEVGRINVSDTTYFKLRHLYEFEHRGKIMAKNKGEIDMYFLNDEASENQASLEL